MRSHLTARPAAIVAFVVLACVGRLAADVSVDDVKSRLAAVDADKYDADAVVVLDATDVTVRPSGIGESRMQQVVKVLREGGIRDRSVQRFSFDPTTNKLTVSAVRVYRKDGQVEEVPVAAAVDQPEPQWGIYWGSRQVLIGVPRLEVGDAVETVYTKIGFNVAYLAGEGAAGGADGEFNVEPPMPGHWYDEVEFWTSIPVVEKRYTVRTPKDKPIQFEVYNGEVRTSVTFDGDHIVYSFEKRDIKPYRGEPRSASTRDTQCKLVLATLEDWKAKSRWFHEKNEANVQPTEEIRTVAQQVIAGCKTDEERITALNHWVAENIRYVGTSRGACEGYTTHCAAETLRDRGGVCKDKAGLLVAMLRSVGFDSYIVMTQAGTDVSPIPADQFNHAVTSIRNKDGSFRLLDPTWMPKNRENWSSAEQLQFVVYGTPEGVDLSLSPYSGPEENTATLRAHSTVEACGDLATAVELTTVGAPETALRRSLAGRRGAVDVPRYFDELVGRLATSAVCAEFEAMEAVDFSGPMRVALRAKAPRYVLGSADRRLLRLPGVRNIFEDVIAGDLDRMTDEKRTLPIRLRSTRRLDLVETVALPDGWNVVSMPESKSIDGPAASLRFTASHAGGKIEYSLVLDVKKRTIPPDEYANYRQVMDALHDIRERYVVCAMESASASK